MAHHSSADRPDLDWSQVRETVKLLTASVAQVENSMKVGDKSVNTLTESFTSMVGHLQAIHGALETMDNSDIKSLALEHCHASTDTINASIMAFQFYDRLQQCLDHVSMSLRGLSDLVEDPSRLYNPIEWRKFQQEIRDRFTMETEKVMFDAILAGKSINEALAIATEIIDNTPLDEDDVELF